MPSSDHTRSQTLVSLIKKSRFGITSELFESVMTANLFKFETGYKKITNINKDDVVDSVFEESIISNLNSIEDYIFFVRRFNVSEDMLAFTKTTRNKEQTLLNSSLDISKIKHFSSSTKLKKWRSMELKVASILEEMEGVINVIDVSKQNVGYDIEVMFSNGKKQYYEVKSVQNLGDEFTVTNNEYSTANQFSDSYNIIIACEKNNKLELCFINNPIKTLLLDKRSTRWEWMCSEYKGKTLLLDLSD